MASGKTTFDFITENNGYRCIIGNRVAIYCDCYDVDERQVRLMNSDGSVFMWGDYSNVTLDGRTIA